MLKLILAFTAFLCSSYAQNPLYFCIPATLNIDIPKVEGKATSEVTKTETVSGSGYASAFITQNELSEESSKSINGSGSSSSSVTTNEVPNEPIGSGSGSVSVVTNEIFEETPNKTSNSGKPQLIDEVPNFIFGFNTGDIKQHVQGTSRTFRNTNGTISIGEGQYGNYSYTGTDGKVRTVVFKSDENGYQPRFV